MGKVVLSEWGSQSFLRDPYPFYQDRRETEPVWYDERRGTWTLFRYEDVHRALRDDENLTAERSGSRSMLSSDPPAHTRLRAFAARAFTAKSVRALRPRVEAIIDELLAGVRHASEMDVISQFAYPLPLTVIAELLGVEIEQRDFFRDASRRIAVALGPLDNPQVALQAIQAREELIRYFDGLVSRKRAEPGDDLVSALVATESEQEGLTCEELQDMLVLLLVGGHETTVNLIANGLLALLRRPEAFEMLRKGDVGEEQAVEELLRYDAPVQYTGRTAVKDCEIGGREIRKDDLVRMALASANRDPEKFNDPDTLELGREPNPHLAFGAGIHYCLGAPLARLEGRLAITALIRRFPRMQLSDVELRYRPATVLRGLDALPVTLG
jgi:cytochrome P450